MSIERRGLRSRVRGIGTWALAAMVATTGGGLMARPATAPPVQLYTIDCGRLDANDLGDFSDTGEHEGERGVLAVPCYLIHHGADWLLWDTGLGDRLAAKPDGEMLYGLRFTVRRTLVGQLALLHLTPADIRFVALSHLHTDHAGNIGLFLKATFLIATSELAWARGSPTPPGISPALIVPLANARVDASDDDRDVFGDGSVRILKGPGHTPGHRFLLVRLAKAGPIMITGDLYHTRENLEKGLVPKGNVDRAATLASFNRFAGLRATTHARVVVEHSPEDFAAMPAFPAFLD